MQDRLACIGLPGLKPVCPYRSKVRFIVSFGDTSVPWEQKTPANESSRIGPTSVQCLQELVLPIVYICIYVCLILGGFVKSDFDESRNFDNC